MKVKCKRYYIGNFEDYLVILLSLSSISSFLLLHLLLLHHLLLHILLLKGYPRLSETFIAQEILELERRGLPIEIVSLRHPTDKNTHPVHDEIRASVRYLPEYLYKEVGRVWRAWRAVRNLPAYKAVRGLWLADLKRDFTPNRVRRFGQALVLAAELPEEIQHLYAHFLHTPASVTRYAAGLRGLLAPGRRLGTVGLWKN